ncbi:CONSTANS, CO-like and TOC1 motif [Hibiscus trionum]|uniref:CONSTANS, CO-like and TOC1 motif n=1 Tax=Hibiscus trionum TaxID=183268 RepID=A0A9W7J1K2_HIBTR|nr:CONSTANS, CO-like and TOC1 motif [Hibiscus trionum]
MYSETGLFFPYMQNFNQDFELFEEYYKTQKPNASMNDMVQISEPEYNLEGEVDMFKALEPIIEEPIVGLDPMTAAISLISCGEDVITSEGLKAADIESFLNEQLLEALYECEKDLMAEAAIEAPLAVVLDFETPVVKIDESQNQENEVLGDASFQKSVSSGSLSSMGSVQGAAIEPNFLDFSLMDFGSVYTIRRAFSEGDIKTLGNGNVSVIHSPIERPLPVSSCSTEDRREKLSRYRNKKMKRNFGRKIKYACRKALADSQPRIHGRFAKIEESDDSKRKLLFTN